MSWHKLIGIKISLPRGGWIYFQDQVVFAPAFQREQKTKNTKKGFFGTPAIFWAEKDQVEKKLALVWWGLKDFLNPN